ncbi:MAG: alkyl hydroperoxide reductase subunit F [Actinomycetota bacterium]|nr:alkyl hydroperoxide reductase subunit F [Actinomycetota bacterium]MDG2120071.1 alkyl hydroperoxide reductase subunit F [Actinomycetota bacterium]
MLERHLLDSLEAHLEKLVFEVVFVASLDDSEDSFRLRSFLTEVSALSRKLHFETGSSEERVPSFRVERLDSTVGVAFAAIPLGHEFTSFVLAVLQVGGHPPVISSATREAILKIDTDCHFETFVSLSCQKCPDVVQALNIMAVLNPKITHTTVDGGLFTDEAVLREIGSVPAIHLNGELFEYGSMSIESILGRLDSASLEESNNRISELKPYDVAIIGGGPAGAAAGLYTSRKGLRTVIVTDRLGGQLLDTLGIENFVSVPYTEGPRLAADLETHLRTSDIELLTSQTVSTLQPSSDAGGLHTVIFESGAQITARSVILSTGARWRLLDVPGEQDYLNKGVAFCPHCDGPLFKGKKVAVIGGGNSGVEAAIDLAGLASHVTVIEYAPQLLADAVLQDALKRRDNVAVVVNAATTSIVGNGVSVTGLSYEARDSGKSMSVELDGIFVQIGLIPNTEWLKNTVELSQRGEIIVDVRGSTSLPGVFAAGDCTTEPFKQIIIAMGAGSTAALGAFDYLIRNRVNEDSAVVAG